MLKVPRFRPWTPALFYLLPTWNAFAIQEIGEPCRISYPKKDQSFHLLDVLNIPYSIDPEDMDIKWQMQLRCPDQTGDRKNPPCFDFISSIID